MVALNFEPSLACVNAHEGGRDDDPRDSGGRTAYGVTQARYNQYLRDQHRGPADVWAITMPERVAIWRAYYWAPVRGDDLPAGLDYVVFDGGVNSGPVQAIKWVQRAVNDVCGASGAILVDGQMGTNTLAAINAIDDIDALIDRMQNRRLAMLKELRTWRYYGRGWSRRVEDVRKLGQAVARGSVVLAPPAGWTTAQGKAFASDAKPLPNPTSGTIASALGAVSGAVTQIQPVVQPLQGSTLWADAALTGVMYAGVAATLAGMGWAAYAAAKSRSRASALGLVPPEASVTLAPVTA